VDAALLAIAHVAASPACQQVLLEVGVLPHVVPLLLAYDPTLSADAAARLAVPFTPGAGGAGGGAGGGKEGEGGGGGGEGLALLDSPLVRGSQAEARSQHALLAARALGRLAGEERHWRGGMVWCVVCGVCIQHWRRAGEVKGSGPASSAQTVCKLCVVCV
jgi:hypothetical protein